FFHDPENSHPSQRQKAKGKKMDKEYLTISFEKYPELNIGGVLLANLKELEECKVTGGLLKVANEYWHGCFQLLDAVGFSVPISVCRGGYLQMVSTKE